jgi:hypothetical protein
MSTATISPARFRRRGPVFCDGWGCSNRLTDTDEANGYALCLDCLWKMKIGPEPAIPFARAADTRDDILPLLRRLRAHADSVTADRRSEWDAAVAVLEGITTQ